MVKVCVLSRSIIPSDPRVRRQCDLFHDVAWDVVAVGLPSPPDKSCRWELLNVVAGDCASGSDNLEHTTSWKILIKKMLGPWITRIVIRVTTIVMLVSRYLLFYFSSRSIEKDYWGDWRNRIIYDAARNIHADLWVANDWNMLPVAARLASENGGKYVYDTHEFAVNEYAERWDWRLFERPIVKSVEGRYIGGAKAVSAVSPGIATELQKLYDLPSKPLVVRNAPLYRQNDFNPTKHPIRVLYHGIIAPGRGLEETISSVKSWKENFVFVIRGPGHQEYLDKLKQLITLNEVQDRVLFSPPVPMIELVERAREFDIGFFALKGHSLHNMFALPNKLFEYTMAGLALCVSALPEMKILINEHDNGKTFETLNPPSIAECINSFTIDSIDEYKKKSLVAAKDLCWDKESEKLLAAYRQVVSG